MMHEYHNYDTEPAKLECRDGQLLHQCTLALQKIEELAYRASSSSYTLSYADALKEIGFIARAGLSPLVKKKDVPAQTEK